MKLRHLLHLGSALTLGAAVALAAAPAIPPARPNVLLVIIDDMNNWPRAFGGPAETPNIDALTRSGMQFANAYCVVPLCNASRTALFTGLRPETTRQFGNEGNFRTQHAGNEAILTLPQRLRAVGYEAVAAGKVFHQPRGAGSQPDPLSDPVSWNDQWAGWIGTPGREAYLEKNGWARWLHGDRHGIDSDYLLQFAVWGPIPETDEETGDWQAADFCARYVAQTHERPFFLTCGIHRPHAPFLAPKKYFDRLPPEQVPTPSCPPDDMDDIPAIAKRNFSTPLVAAIQKEGEWRNAIRGYLACMNYVDACVGRVLDALARSPNRDNTIVIFCSDNGFHLGEKNRWEKYSLWRQATNVPLVIRAPGYKPGVCLRAVSFLDLQPTVMALVGQPIPTELQGESLLPWLQDPSLPRERPAVITYPEGNYSVVRDDWNYIRYQDGSEELYDHRIDHAEYSNLARRPEHVAVMADLRRWLPERGPSPHPKAAVPATAR